MAKIKGKAFVINKKEKITPEKTNQRIVVARSLKPRDLINLINCKAIVVEEGGQLAHIAIFCREVNIPFKIIKKATKKIKTGEDIEIDLD